MGSVALVGGGPGNSGLLSVQGRQLLEQADCILYDSLLEPSILDVARKDCERIAVGKRAGKPSLSQREIERLLVQKAKEHALVVRLKGGDPFVFGRGGEEGLFLREQGIPFIVVPGISSAIAALTASGIPITHRGIARGFHVFTAHNNDDRFADMDISAYAAGSDTLVFLMGLAHCDELVQRLLAGGKPADTPAAILSQITWESQQVLEAPLALLPQKLKEHPLPAPAVIVVGEVVALRRKLSAPLPLAGCRIVVAHPGERSRMTTLLTQAGAMVDEICTGRIQLLSKAISLSDITAAQWLVFTSQNSAKAFVEAIVQQRTDVRRLAHIRFACVGKATAAVLEELHLYADLIPVKQEAAELAKLLQKEVCAKQRVLILGKEGGNEALLRALRPYCQVCWRGVYRNDSVPLSPKAALQRFDYALFTCASAAAACAPLFHAGEQPVCISIGPLTSKALKEAGVSCLIESETASFDGCLKQIQQEWKERNKDVLSRRKTA